MSFRPSGKTSIPENDKVKYFRYLSLQIDSGNLRNLQQKRKINTCKFWRYIIDSGKASISEFDKFKYLKCLSLHIDSGNVLNLVRGKCNALTYMWLKS
ncbi:hypothetical protein Hanom_Chr01g00089521 [Helianthus anomalus]